MMLQRHRTATSMPHHAGPACNRKRASVLANLHGFGPWSARRPIILAAPELMPLEKATFDNR
jgi:hypothetical protein